MIKEWNPTLHMLLKSFYPYTTVVYGYCILCWLDLEYNGEITTLINCRGISQINWLFNMILRGISIDQLTA
jgi:hypothetical protein